jgi:hypothetical protein
MNIMDWSYDQQVTDFNRLESLQNTYDNVVAEEQWPTVSKVPLATMFGEVEQALSQQFEHMFPPSPFTRVYGVDQDIDKDSIEKVEWALYVTLIWKMKLQKNMLRSIKDCLKLGIGYGIVEPIRTTPPVAREFPGLGGRRMMSVGPVRESLRLRYLNVGRVVPYPTGTDFNGTYQTPVSFFVDSYDELTFRALFEQNTDGESVTIEGSPEKFIEQAKTSNVNCNVESVIDALGGRPSYLNTQQTEQDTPATIPVIKCYEHRKHSWVAFDHEGPKVIYRKEDEVETLRCNLIKFDAWPDSDRWFPMSAPEAQQRNHWQKNIWFNLIMDMMTLNGKPTLVWDNTVHKEPPQAGPEGQIGLPGDVKQTVTWMPGPPVDQNAMQFGDLIDKNRQEISGRQDFMGKNYTRGGAQAFQELMNTTQGKDRLIGRMLEMSALQSICEQTLLYLQLRAAEAGEEFRAPTWDSDAGGFATKSMTVTEKDFVHNYGLVLDLGEKYRQGAENPQLEMQRIQMMLERPEYDNRFVARLIARDEWEAQRLMRSPEEIKDIQQRREAAEEEGQRVGLQRAQQQAQRTMQGGGSPAGPTGGMA